MPPPRPSIPLPSPQTNIPLKSGLGISKGEGGGTAPCRALSRQRRLTGHALLENETLDLAAVLIRLGPYDKHIGVRRVGDPRFGAAEAVRAGFRIVTRARLHAAWIGAVVGLCETEAPDEVAGDKTGQVLVTLRLATVRVYRVYDQRRLHAHRRAVAAVHSLHFASHQTVRDRRNAGATVVCNENGSRTLPQLRHGHSGHTATISAQPILSFYIPFCIRCGKHAVTHHTASG